MRVLSVADLHQRRVLYDRLAAAVAVRKPDVVALVGDFLDGDGWGEGLLTPEAAACELAELTAGREVVFVRGNHDAEGWPAFETTWRAIRPDCHALHGSAVTLRGLTILGFPCQMGDARFYAHGRPLPCPASDTAGWLDPLMERLGAAGRGLWLMHEPPLTGLDGLPRMAKRDSTLAAAGDRQRARPQPQTVADAAWGNGGGECRAAGPSRTRRTAIPDD